MPKDDKKSIKDDKKTPVANTQSVAKTDPIIGIGTDDDIDTLDVDGVDLGLDPDVLSGLPVDALTDTISLDDALLEEEVESEEEKRRREEEEAEVWDMYSEE